VRDFSLVTEACDVLGVDRLAETHEIRLAWKRKLKSVHPDAGGSKRAAQHVNNMRDVLLAWVAAGRPDCGACSSSARPADFHANYTAQSFNWPPAHQWRYSWRRCLTIVGVWLALLSLSILSSAPRTHVTPHLFPDNLARCEQSDTLARTSATIRGKCWPN
jgi:hypothetical protein